MAVQQKVNLPAIARARLGSQWIAGTASASVKDVVAHMGAIQAQDYSMAKWAIGLRLPGSTEQTIEASFAKKEIIRTHVLRPTWHIIPASAIYWMLSLSAKKIKMRMKTMDKQLGLTEKIYSSSNAVIEKCLQHGHEFTREEIALRLNKAKIDTGTNRLSHLLIRAELDAIACSGTMQQNKKTYALLHDIVPHRKPPAKEESLAMLAAVYFKSRGPATVADFTWWSGLSVTEARQAHQSVKATLSCITIQQDTFWFNQDAAMNTGNKPALYLLPAYDEFIISYKDRTAVLGKQHHKKVLSVNGFFNPVIVVDGQVTGTWKRSVQKGQVCINTNNFSESAANTSKQLQKRAAAFAKYAGIKKLLLHPADL